MPRIELAEQTYARLFKRATSFSDNADQVILRLLDETEPVNDSLLHAMHQDGRGKAQLGAPRAIPGSILPEREYWLPILEIIEQSGGSAVASDVIDSLIVRMEGLLKPRDYEKLAMGEVRWRNRARFARLRMTEQGLLSDTSHRGLWEITNAGRRYLEAGGD